MRICSPEDTVSTLVDSGFPLAVSCHRCRHRTIFDFRQIRAYEAHYRTVHRLPLLCRCGCKDLDRYLLDAIGEAGDFLKIVTHIAELNPPSDA